MERIVLEHTVFFSHYPPWHPRKIVKSNKQCTVFPPEKRQPFNKVYNTSGQVNHYMGVEFVWKMVTIQGHGSGCNSTPQPSVSKPAALLQNSVADWIFELVHQTPLGITVYPCLSTTKNQIQLPGTFAIAQEKLHISYISNGHIPIKSHQIILNHIESPW